MRIALTKRETTDSHCIPGSHALRERAPLNFRAAQEDQIRPECSFRRARAGPTSNDGLGERICTSVVDPPPPRATCAGSVCFQLKGLYGRPHRKQRAVPDLDAPGRRVAAGGLGGAALGLAAAHPATSRRSIVTRRSPGRKGLGVPQRTRGRESPATNPLGPGRDRLLHGWVERSASISAARHRKWHLAFSHPASSSFRRARPRACSRPRGNAIELEPPQPAQAQGAHTHAEAVRQARVPDPNPLRFAAQLSLRDWRATGPASTVVAQ